MPYFVLAVFLLTGLFVFILGLKTFRKIRIIRDTPTSNIKTMAQGLVEISGIADATGYLTSPITKTKCLYYLYIEEVYESRDKDHSASWHKVSSKENFVSFFVKDNTGNIQIIPDKAEFKIPPDRVFIKKSHNNLFDNISKGFSIFNTVKNSIKKTGSLQGALNDNFQSLKKGERSEILEEFSNLKEVDVSTIGGYKTKNTSFSISFGRDSANSGDRRYIEYYIKPQDTVFILGEFKGDSIHYSELENIFIISDRSEKETISNIKKKAYFFIIFGVIMFLFSLFGIITIIIDLTKTI